MAWSYKFNSLHQKNALTPTASHFELHLHVVTPHSNPSLTSATPSPVQTEPYKSMYQSAQQCSLDMLDLVLHRAMKTTLFPLCTAP